MKSMNRLSRRAVLRGVGGIVVGLPLLEAMEAHAQTAGRPKRYLGFWYSGAVGSNGYWPSGTERAFTLGTVLSPLQPHIEHILVPDGLNMRLTGGGDAHTQAINTAFTGTAQSNYASGPSIDQVIADKIGATSRFKSLQIGVGVDVSSPWSRITHAGKDRPIAPDGDPKSVFNRLFASGAPANSGADRVAAILAERRSILDSTKESYQRLLNKVGGGDRQRIEAHLTAIRELEQRLSALPSVGCDTPAQPTVGGGPFSNLPAIGRAHMDLVAAAFACDQTRVITMQWARAATNQTFSWLGLRTGQHDYSHNGTQPRAEMALMAKWFMEQLAYLVGKLKAIPDAGGSVLDNTLIFAIAEHSTTHSAQRIPALVVGKCGGAVQTGRYLRFNGRPHNDLLAGIGNAFGLNLNTFGSFGSGTPIALG